MASDFNYGLKATQFATAVTALSGASGTVTTGTSIPIALIEFGTLVCNLYVQATTNSLAIAGKWQVSSDGSTFYDLFSENNAANVTVVTGTGSAVASTRRVSAPLGVYAYKYARYAITHTGASAGAGDEWSQSVNYIGRGTYQA